MIHLYVKTHIITGKKYFGKTSSDPFTYKGSGKLWKRILNEHGGEVSTIVVASFSDDEKDLAKAFAKDFSQENRIVESDTWANLKMEELDGGWESLNASNEENNRRRHLAGKKSFALHPESALRNLRMPGQPEERKARSQKGYSTLCDQYGMTEDGKGKFFVERGVRSGNNQSPEKRARIAKSLTGFKTINDGTQQCRVLKEEAERLVAQGWVYGRLK